MTELRKDLFKSNQRYGTGNPYSDKDSERKGNMNVSTPPSLKRRLTLMAKHPSSPFSNRSELVLDPVLPILEQWEADNLPDDFDPKELPKCEELTSEYIEQQFKTTEEQGG